MVVIDDDEDTPGPSGRGTAPRRGAVRSPAGPRAKRRPADDEIEVLGSPSQQPTPHSAPKRQKTAAAPRPAPVSPDAQKPSCPVCLEGFNRAPGTEMTSTPCGHVFCHKCITEWVQAAVPSGKGKGANKSATCPTCTKRFQGGQLRRIFLTI